MQSQISDLFYLGTYLHLHMGTYSAGHFTNFMKDKKKSIMEFDILEFQLQIPSVEISRGISS